jgi:UDP-glucose 4-epimerase
MRCVVTGSAGFIGCHVCAVLLEGGHDVVGVDAFTDYYDSSFKRSIRETGGAVNRAPRLLGWRPDAALSEGIKRQTVHQLSRVRA